MSDIIYYKNGEETFRISPPTNGTKCPETKLEVKKMTSNKEIELLKQEIKMLQSKLEFLEEIEKHKSQPIMVYVNEGGVEIVSYNDKVYYRLDLPDKVYWYMRKEDGDGAILLKQITDGETHRLLEGVWFNEVRKGKYPDEPYCPDEPDWYDEVESDIDENKEKPKTLYNLIDRWWMDVFCGINTDWDMETSIEDLCDRIELWNMRNKK